MWITAVPHIEILLTRPCEKIAQEAEACMVSGPLEARSGDASRLLGT